MKHNMKLNLAPFNKVKNGSKTLELRLNDEKRQKVNVGDEIEFSLITDLEQKIITKVKDIHHFSTFKDLFYALNPSEYGSLDKNEYVEMYKYYSPEDEKKYGVVALRIARQ